MGDSYTPTIVFDHREEKFKVSTWADEVERLEGPAEQEKESDPSGPAPDVAEISDARPRESSRPLSKTEQFRKGFVDKVVDLMGQGTAPWQRPWIMPPSCMPVNAVSGKKYNGNNIFYLMITGMQEGYEDPRWVTYKQAQEKGWQVRKGEKGTKIEYWNQYDSTKTKKGAERLDEQIRDMMGAGASHEKIEKMQEGYSAGYIKHYTVFNAAQIEGIPPLEIEPVIKDFRPHERAENIMDHCGVPIVYGAAGAAYSPSKDRIKMPNREMFTDENHFYATVLHEIAHSTGHSSRLNRKEGMESHFGTQEYAKEELRAEMASLFIHADIGLEVTEEEMKEHTEQHAAYVQHWLKSLKEDYKEFYRATRDASKIADYVLAYERDRGTEQERKDIAETENVMPDPAPQPETPEKIEPGEAARAIPGAPPEEAVEPRPGQRVIFLSNDGKIKLTGEVVETNEGSVTLRCGKMTVPVLKDGGTFAGAPEPDRSETKEYAEERAKCHTEEGGNVFFARGEGAVYRGVVVEVTPNFAIQKVGENAILHRLKDLAESENHSMIEEGRSLSISKERMGNTTIQAWDMERREREQENRRSNEGQSR
jgi:antirestriction protein ArdC